MVNLFDIYGNGLDAGLYPSKQQPLSGKTVHEAGSNYEMPPNPFYTAILKQIENSSDPKTKE